MTTTAIAPPVTVAPVCPVCRSAVVVCTNGKPASDNSYWRCDTCGEIWNPSRLSLRPRPARLW
jgi:transposase-like protein